MTFFALLPSDVQLLVLQSWIGRHDDGGIQLLKALTALDIAVCHHSDRSAFLHLLSHPAIKWPQNTINTHTIDPDDLEMKRTRAVVDCIGALKWLKCRRLRLTAKDILSPGTQQFAVIPTITAVFSHHSIPAGLLAACPNLTSIECRCASAMWKKLASTSHRVKRLVSLQDYHPKAQSSVEAICTVLRADFLEELKVQFVPPNQQILQTLCGCTNLKVLRVPGLQSHHLLQILRSNARLTDLTVVQFLGGKEVLLHVLSNGKQLRRFQNRYWSYLADAFTILAMALEKCPWLEYVYFNQCSYDKTTGCLQLLDAESFSTDTISMAIDCILAHCRIFPKLLLCASVHTALFSKLSALTKAFAGSRLRELSVHGYGPNMSKHELLSFLGIALCAPLLERLELCKVSISDEELKQLGQSCKALRHLTIEGSSREHLNLSDDGFEALVAGCGLLQELKLAFIDGLSSKSLAAILTHRLPLQRLSWARVGFGEKEVARFRRDAAEMQLLPVPFSVLN